MTTPDEPPSFNSDAIQRVLFIASAVHVYSIPPLTSNKGYNASTWTADNNKRQIFTVRIRVIETAVPLQDGTGESLSTEILLEDPSTGNLFAGAPYTDGKVVEAALDSSRFFAVRVVGDGGMKATLGIGFEERSEAIDFGICLQEARKILGMDPSHPKVAGKGAGAALGKEPEQRDWSLKEGQTIKVDIGRRGRRKDGAQAGELGGGSSESAGPGADGKAWFSIKPPSEKGASDGGSSLPILAPPPLSVSDARAEKRRSRGLDFKVDAQSLGFDDGEFGEFQ